MQRLTIPAVELNSLFSMSLEMAASPLLKYGGRVLGIPGVHDAFLHHMTRLLLQYQGGILQLHTCRWHVLALLTVLEVLNQTRDRVYDPLPIHIFLHYPMKKYR